MENIYADIAKRSDGAIMIGVVGPVRTGKSTFIKRFMDLLVIPNIENVYSRDRARDELPQSGAGRMIMTIRESMSTACGLSGRSLRRNMLPSVMCCIRIFVKSLEFQNQVETS